MRLIHPCLATALGLLVCTASAETSTALDTPLQRLSYGIGLQVAQNLRQQGLSEIDAVVLALAIEDMLSGREPRLSAEQLQAAFTAYQEESQALRRQQAQASLAAANEFLSKNRESEGVVELESGLQYRIITAGDGAKPNATDTVRVHYRGRLLDGTEFDSSHSRGQPTEFTIGQVIPGWQEALQRMTAGSTWELWIPPGLAYGERGAGGSIGPNQALHFEIELIEVHAGS